MCVVCCDTGEDHTVFWNHGGSVLSMNERVFVPSADRLITVTAGDAPDTDADDDAGSHGNDLVVYTLRLDSISLEDEGDYSCQVPSQPGLVQRHRIDVHGQTFQLNCSSHTLYKLFYRFNHRRRRFYLKKNIISRIKPVVCQIGPDKRGNRKDLSRCMKTDSDGAEVMSGETSCLDKRPFIEFCCNSPLGVKTCLALLVTRHRCRPCCQRQQRCF